MERRTHLLTVFELSNRANHEFYVGATDVDFSEFISRTKTAPPPELSGWKLDRDVYFRSLAFGMQPREAATFVREYSRSLAAHEHARVIVSQVSLSGPA